MAKRKTADDAKARAAHAKVGMERMAKMKEAQAAKTLAAAPTGDLAPYKYLVLVVVQETVGGKVVGEHQVGNNLDGRQEPFVFYDPEKLKEWLDQFPAELAG
jgi:hypothetical protein